MPVITAIENVDAFKVLLQNNPGLLIIKFGASWCGPCKKIEPLVERWFSSAPSTIQCCKIDIDESFEIYGFLKSKRRVNGVPVILCYKKGNLNYIPDDTVVGSDEKQNNDFFLRCQVLLDSIPAAPVSAEPVVLPSR